MGRAARPSFGLALAGLTMLACASNGEQVGNVAERATAQNTTCAVGAACKLTALYPSGIPAGKLVLVGKQGISIGSQAEVRGTSGALGFAATATGFAEVQAQAKVGGVWTRGDAFVGSQALVDGKVLVGGTPTIQAGATTGGVGAATGDPASATFTVTFPSGTVTDVTLQNNTARSLAPGRYGTLHVFNGSKVTLTSGVYYFEEVILESGAQAVVTTTNGTAVVWVRGLLTSRGTWTSTGNPSDILVGSFYMGQIDLGQQFDATLVAPDADVLLGSGNSPSIVHNGQYFGRTITVQGGARVSAVAVSKQGPAYGGLGGVWTPAAGVTPPAAPSPTGLTYDQYRAQLRAFLSGLLDSGYSGPPITVAAHPDATRVRDLSTFQVPSGENNPHATPITIASAAPVATRPIVPVGSALPSGAVALGASTTDGRALPSDSFPNSPHLTAAFSQLHDEVTAAETKTTTELPFTNQSDPATGRGVKPPPNFPKNCQLANRQISSDATVGQVQDEFPIPFHRGLSYGQAPAWINQDAFPDEDARVIDSAVPEFDAYWFMNGYLESGFAAQRGLYGEIGAQFGVGGAVLGFPIRIVDVKVAAEADANDERDGRGGDPFLSAQLVAYAAGTTWYKFGRSVDVDIPKPVFKQNLLDGTFKLIPGNGLEFPVGPFVVEVNAGVQMSAPLALNIDTSGPEATFAPMIRAFISVFGGIDFGIKVGLEGEADLLRVDAPFSAKLKWTNRLNPQECAMSADFKATLSMNFTTLNGTLYAVAGISDSLIPGAMYREPIVSWKGITLLSEEINLIDVPFPQVLKYPDFLCQFGAQTCATTATPNASFADFETSHQGFQLVDSRDYGSTECPGQYVVEVPVANFTGDGVWVQAKWRAEDVTTADLCNQSFLRMDAWKLQNGSWVQLPAVNIKGAFDPNVGCVQTATGANLPDGQSQLFNNPWTFITKDPGVTKIRFAATTEVDCSTQRIQLTASDHRF